jgi:hypothetical protein
MRSPKNEAKQPFAANQGLDNLTPTTEVGSFCPDNTTELPHLGNGTRFRLQSEKTVGSQEGKDPRQPVALAAEGKARWLFYFAGREKGLWLPTSRS